MWLARLDRLIGHLLQLELLVEAQLQDVERLYVVYRSVEPALQSPELGKRLYRVGLRVELASLGPVDPDQLNLVVYDVGDVIVDLGSKFLVSGIS